MTTELERLNAGPRASNGFWKFSFHGLDAGDRAMRLLKAAGFSVGRMQRGSPRGLLLGDYDIQKWRNLRPNEREALHGKLWGGRLDPVVIDFPSSLPVPVNEAVWVLHRLIQAEEAATKRPVRAEERIGS